MGSQYYYSSAGQEFRGHWWVTGRVLGKQYNFAIPDEHAAEMLVAWGWSGMMSHNMPQARKVLKGFSKDPDRLLVAIDPRRSETATISDIHLPFTHHAIWLEDELNHITTDYFIADTQKRKEFKRFLFTDKD